MYVRALGKVLVLAALFLKYRHPSIDKSNMLLFNFYELNYIYIYTHSHAHYLIEFIPGSGTVAGAFCIIFNLIATECL